MSGRAAYRETLGYPNRLRAVWPFLRIISDRWHQRVRLACGHQRRHSGTTERPQKLDKGHWQPGEGKDFKGTVPRDLVCRIRGWVPSAVKPDAWGRGSRGLEREPSARLEIQRGALGRECTESDLGGG